MSTINQAAVGNAAGNYGMQGGLGSYLSNSLGNYLQTGISSGSWGKGNFISAFGDKGASYNSNIAGGGSLTGFDSGIGAVAGFAGGLLDRSAAHQRTSGKYGHVAQTVDTVGNIAGSVGNFNPIASGAGRFAMGAVNKITGGTDGMTVQDSLLGSGAVQGALTGLAAATGPIGWGVAGAYLLASGINAATGKTTADNAYKSFMDKDKLTDVASGYTDMDLENEAESLYNKKYGGFSMGAYKKAQKKIEKAQMRMTDKIDIRDMANLGQIRAGMVDANRLNYQMAINGGYKPLAIGRYGLKIDPERLAEAKRIAKCIKKKKSPIFDVIPAEAREAMRDVTKVPNDALPFFKEGGNIELFQNGGDVNVIPEGALHARKHHMENDEHITKKGIPVVDINGTQQAEIERNEIIFRKEVTNRLEELAKDGSDKAAIEAGKLLAQEIIENTDDRTGLIQQITGDSVEKIPMGANGFSIDSGTIANAATNVIGTFIAGRKAQKLKEQQDKLALEKQNLEDQKKAAEFQKGFLNYKAQTDQNGNVSVVMLNNESTMNPDDIKAKEDALSKQEGELLKQQQTQENNQSNYLNQLVQGISSIDFKALTKGKSNIPNPNTASTANAANITKVATAPNIPEKIKIQKDGDKLPDIHLGLLEELKKLSPEQLKELQAILKYLKQ